MFRAIFTSLAAAMMVGCQGQRPAGGDGFRDTFTVGRSALVPTGAETFFPLDPGAVRTFKDGDEMLTITTTGQTRVIDGITARVIEEREENEKGLVEISRNFFAADPGTGDVYYLGEEVDIYKDGKVVKHEGAWISGKGGARFGLMTPGKPAVGDRYYQEIAPGVAMDRAEVVSIDERVETPAGVFEHCLHIKETTPLERGTGHKWFARGVGMVKDGSSVLVSRK